MAKRLKVFLTPGWTDVSDENPGGLATYSREGCTGVLQFSFAEYRGRRRPDVTEPVLAKMAASMLGEKIGQGAPVTVSGRCDFGVFGSAEGSSDLVNRARYWAISDGMDVIFVTFVSTEPPTPEEWQESQDIALRTRLGPGRPWWKVW